MTDARETAAMNLHMYDAGSAYGEQLAEQIIEQFKDSPKTTALVREVAGLTADNLASMEHLFRFEDVDEDCIATWRAAVELAYDARLGRYALTEMAELAAVLLADAAASLRKCAASYNNLLDWWAGRSAA
jgi:hypothetical protein